MLELILLLIIREITSSLPLHFLMTISWKDTVFLTASDYVQGNQLFPEHSNHN